MRSGPPRRACGNTRRPAGDHGRVAVLFGPPDTAVPDVERPSGRLAIAGLVGALWAASIGLVATTTLALIGWVAAPHEGYAQGIPGVLRAAVQIWLVAHHASFAFPGGHVGLLPLGLLILPALLLLRAGDWVARVGRIARLRHVVPAAIALAAPYALLAGALARLVTSSWLRPSLFHSLLGCFVLACVVAGTGAVRALGWRRAVSLFPERARAVTAGATGGVLVLVACGALLVGVALATHLQRAGHLAETLAPGVVGGLLLLALQAAYVPNAVTWGIAYAVGPGFAVGVGTEVAASGINLGGLPAFPLLAALPDPGTAPPVSYLALAGPYLAGGIAGLLTARRTATFSAEVTALWGSASGACAGIAVGVLAALSAGSLGDGRLAVVGPVWWEVGALGILELGLSAAVVAWITDRVMNRA